MVQQYGLTIHSARAKTFARKWTLNIITSTAFLICGDYYELTRQERALEHCYKMVLQQERAIAPHPKQVQACTFLEDLGFGTKQLVCIRVICDRRSTRWIMVELCWWEKLCLQDVILWSSICRNAGNKVASWISSFCFGWYYPAVNMQPCNDLCPQQNRRLKTFQKWACNWQQGSLFGKSQIARLQLTIDSDYTLS